MAQKVIITLVDDLDGSPIDEGKGETLRFGIDGSDYEIDLSERNAEKLRETLEPYVQAARGAGKARRATDGSRARTASSSNSKEDLAAARGWLRSQGHKVSDRGRISNELMELYRNSK